MRSIAHDAHAADARPAGPGFCGIWGLPYVDLAPLFDTAPLTQVDAEVCLGLSRVATSYTGGSLKWMGVVAPHVQGDGYVDFMHVIEGFSREEFAAFVSLADAPGDFDLDRHRDYRFGDETDHPLTKRQMLYLKYRYGVYFPWKVAYHLLDNVWWEDKNLGAGKAFHREACEVFPRTVQFIRALPFREIGRVVLFGLEANDHAPLHRDTVPGSRDEVQHCITLCPRANKRFYLADPELTTRVHVTTPLYWFNDMDWHGVEPDPYFRYSIRIDGVFEPGFVHDLERYAARKARSV
jgi:Rieske 2Fe-2S family protein